LYSGARRKPNPSGRHSRTPSEKDQSALLSLSLQDFEDEFLFPQSGGIQDAHVLGHLVEVLDTHVLQLDQIERGTGARLILLLLAALLSGMALERLTRLRSYT